MFKQFLDQMHDGMLIIDEHANVRYANQSYYEILGIKQRDITNMQLEDIQSNTRIVDVLKTEQPLINVSFDFKQTGVRIVANITPVYDHNKKKIGAMSVFRDSTKTRLLEDELRQLKGYTAYLKEQLGHVPSRRFLERIESREPIFRDINEKLLRAAQTDSVILLTGESGSGKEVAADVLHELSPRSAEPFIKVNCASIPETLMESEFFGYVEGAFTGAVRSGHKGKFELAHGGTLFLDEIGDMPLPLQSKLLRALQEKKIERIGGEQSISIDVRIIAATNANLYDLVKMKKFREDLYYRLNVIPIHLPPLRERKRDILPLSTEIINDFNQRTNKQLSLSAETKTHFQSYTWPGNIRELRNVLEHAFAMTNTGERIQNDHLPEYMMKRSTSAYSPNEESSFLEQYLRFETIEKEAMIEALDQTNNHRSTAMQLLNMSRRTFYNKLKYYEIDD
ncbi:sigma-54-dependent Fis family transcriptional regulator [Geomicrobium sp. JCM 19039]|uniref:sigma-54 interaction domain-containing protein n=1 Tax=Geomicrobium sp. JCM 19039 TaxID=1460636 RepID=UPI00045F3944|nr:sigma 54-interacting transcriptional regulator [Geomicrobium sp. JCM 19039]GAK13222.1 hypothetical protein JCM19039_3053 [Geomicrobium sp. JCM 19039]